MDPDDVSQHNPYRLREGTDGPVEVEAAPDRRQPPTVLAPEETRKERHVRLRDKARRARIEKQVARQGERQRKQEARLEARRKKRERKKRNWLVPILVGSILGGVTGVTAWAYKYGQSILDTAAYEARQPVLHVASLSCRRTVDGILVKGLVQNISRRVLANVRVVADLKTAGDLLTGATAAPLGFKSIEPQQASPFTIHAVSDARVTQCGVQFRPKGGKPLVIDGTREVAIITVRPTLVLPPPIPQPLPKKGA